MFKYKPRMKEMTDTEMDEMMISCLTDELKSFPPNFISKGFLNGLVHSLKIIVLCDRYNKGERIVENLDLTLI